jgi:hypothetical protein
MDKKENKPDIPNMIVKLWTEKYRRLPPEQVSMYLIEKLDEGTNKLNRLTSVLIGLTVVLAILTGVSLWKLFN